MVKKFIGKRFFLADIALARGCLGPVGWTEEELKDRGFYGRAAACETPSANMGECTYIHTYMGFTPW